MTTLFDQVALALKPYPDTQIGFVSLPDGDIRIYFDFRVHYTRILIDVHPMSRKYNNPKINLLRAKNEEERFKYKKQLAERYKYTYIEIRSPEDITEKLLHCLKPMEESR